MKRRNFVKGLLAAPVAPAVLAAEQAVAKTAPATQPKARSRAFWRGPTNVPHLPLTAVDLTAQPAPQYFTATQFATLRKLGALLQPPLKGNPGAVEAKAPEFLDFLVGVSPADRQKLYLTGLDSLQIKATDTFQKPFSDLDERQASAILKPLLVARDWSRDFPSDPLQHFIAQVHEDLRTATMNSREWAAAAEKSGHLFTRGFRTSGYYWSPIDPISEG
ncbi:MAG: gluconate 2-dehydrogenase subunit 3 family protein [Bryobacteraceae bacterium]